jgi:uncharacterized protein with PIN domain
MLLKTEQKNDQSNKKGHGQYEQFQRCEVCNVPIFRNPRRDVRSLGVFKGKGKILCNKCAVTLAKLPTEQALQTLKNAAETYSK